MIALLIQILIIILVVGVAWWIIGLLPLPAPFGTVAQVVVVLIAVILLFNLLMSLSGGAYWGRLR